MKIVFTETGTEPVTATELKNYLRVDYSDDDTLIGDMITAARQAVEKYCGISIVTKTINLDWENYTPTLQVPYGPVQEYTTLTIDDEAIDEPEDDYIRDDAGVLVIEYVAGYTAVDKALKLAVMELAGVYYEGRSASVEIPEHLKAKLHLYKRNLFI